MRLYLVARPYEYAFMVFQVPCTWCIDCSITILLNALFVTANLRRVASSIVGRTKFVCEIPTVWALADRRLQGLNIERSTEFLLLTPTTSTLLFEDQPTTPITAKSQLSKWYDINRLSGTRLQPSRVLEREKIATKCLRSIAYHCDLSDSFPSTADRSSTSLSAIVPKTNTLQSDVEEPTVDAGEVEVADAAQETEVSAEGGSGSMSVLDALKGVLKIALIHDGLARGLREASKALDRRQAHMCVLNEACEEEAYKKLVVALCGEHKIPLIKVPDGKQLGEWAGLCKFELLLR